MPESQDPVTPSEKVVDDKPPANEVLHNSDAGGLATRGWMTVFGAFCGLFATFGQLNTFGSYQAYYVQHQLAHRSAADISWIGSLQLWAVFFSGMFIGRLFDAYGPRRLIMIGTLFTTLSLISTSFCSKYYQFVLGQGVALGIGTGFVFYPAVSSTQTHFTRLRATAASLAVTGSTAGGIVFPLMLEHLIPRVGFAWAVRISGVVSLVGCVLAFACCTSRLPLRKPRPFMDITTSLKDYKYMMFSFGCAMICFGIFIPFFYVTQFAEQVLQASSARVFTLNSVMNAGSVLGRPIPGLLADTIGRYNVMGTCTFISGILCLSLWLTCTNYTSLVCFSVFYGFFSGAVMSLTPPCVAQISRPEQIGMRVGLAYAVMSVPSLVGGPIAGAILEQQHGSYRGMIIFAGVSLLAGSAMNMSVRVAINPHMRAKV